MPTRWAHEHLNQTGARTEPGGISMEISRARTKTEMDEDIRMGGRGRSGFWHKFYSRRSGRHTSRWRGTGGKVLRWLMFGVYTKIWKRRRACPRDNMGRGSSLEYIAHIGLQRIDSLVLYIIDLVWRSGDRIRSMGFRQTSEARTPSQTKPRS